VVVALSYAVTGVAVLAAPCAGWIIGHCGLVRTLQILHFCMFSALLPLLRVSDSGFCSVALALTLALAIAFFTGLMEPLKYAYISRTIPKDQLRRTNAAFELARTATIIGGPWAAVLLVTIGAGSALGFCALCHLAAAIVLVKAREPVAVRGRSHQRRGMTCTDHKDSLPRFLSLLLASVVGLLAMGTGAQNAMLVVFTEERLRCRAELYGLLTACLGAGMVAGNSVMACRSGLALLRLPVALFCYSVLTVWFAFNSSFAAGMALRLSAGFFRAACVTGLHAAVQEWSIDRRSGSPLAVYYLLTELGQALGAVGAGFMVDLYGSGIVIAACGVVLFVGSGLALRAARTAA